MNVWPVLALGELASVDRKVVDPSALSPETPYIGLEHIDKGGQNYLPSSVARSMVTSTKHAFSCGHILIGKLRPNLAKVILPDFSGVCSTDILPLKLSEHLDASFLRYHLLRPEIVDWLSARATGINLPRISPRTLLELPTPLPPIEEQRRITKILQAAENSNRSVSYLRSSLEKLVLQEAIILHGKPGTPWIKMSEIVESFISGRSFPDADNHSSDSWSVLRVGAVSTGYFEPKHTKPLNASYVPPEGHKVSKGNLLINRSNTPELVGQVAYVWDETQRTTMPDTVWKFNWLDSADATPIYMWATLRTPQMRHAIKNSASGTNSSMSKINRERMMRLSVPWPAHAERAQFEELARKVLEVRELLRQRTERAQELYNSLQYRAFRGEL